jgi:hypothetical protein
VVADWAQDQGRGVHQFHGNIERTVTIEISPQGIAQGVILQSYERARADAPVHTDGVVLEP